MVFLEPKKFKVLGHSVAYLNKKGTMIKIIIFVCLFSLSTQLMPGIHTHSENANVIAEPIVVLDTTAPASIAESVVVESDVIVAVAEPPQLDTTGLAKDCVEWIRAAHLVPTDTMLQLIRRESNCRPEAVNPSSGACGISQALPCSKMGCSLEDPVCQIGWMDNYIQNRYGSWEEALAFHYINNWY